MSLVEKLTGVRRVLEVVVEPRRSTLSPNMGIHNTTNADAMTEFRHIVDRFATGEATKEEFKTAFNVAWGHRNESMLARNTVSIPINALLALINEIKSVEQQLLALDRKQGESDEKWRE